MTSYDIQGILRIAKQQIQQKKYAQAVYLTHIARSEAVKEKNIPLVVISSLVMDEAYESFRLNIEHSLMNSGKSNSAQNVFEAIMDSQDYVTLEKYLEYSNEKYSILARMTTHYPTFYTTQINKVKICNN